MAFTVYGKSGSGFRVSAAAVSLNLSANIAAAAATATTARLAAPSGKTTANFTAGKISDDTNPVSVDIGLDRYTELEWSVVVDNPAINGDVYEFRVVADDVAFETYTVTPTVTIAVPAVLTQFGFRFYNDNGVEA